MRIVIKDETKGRPVTEFVGLKPKMYSFNTCDAVIGNLRPAIASKQVGKGITRAALKDIKHETYLKMYRQGPQQFVINRRIGSLLHNIYSLEARKRGIVPFDDKRFLLADLDDGQPNPNTHAFGHYLIDTAEFPEPEQPPAGADMVIERHEPRANRNQRWEARLLRKHKRAVRNARDLQVDEDADDLDEAQLADMQQKAEARPGLAVRMEDAIDRLTANTRALEEAPCSVGAGPSRHSTDETILDEEAPKSDSEDEGTERWPRLDPFGLRARHRLAIEGGDGQPIAVDKDDDEKYGFVYNYCLHW